MRWCVGTPVASAIREHSPSSAASLERIAAAARSIEELGEDWFASWIIALLVAGALGRAGQIAEGIASVEKAIERPNARRTLANRRVAARER